MFTADRSIEDCCARLICRNLFLARRLNQPMKMFSMITCLILPAKQISAHEFAPTSAIRIRLLDGTELKDWDSFSQEPISDYNPCLSPLASFNSRNQSLLVWNIYRRVNVYKLDKAFEIKYLRSNLNRSLEKYIKHFCRMVILAVLFLDGCTSSLNQRR